jgi:peroxiredoxin
MKRALFAALALTVLALPVQAGKFNKKLNVGDAAPVWTNLPGVDGKKHSLADLKDKELVVVVVTCNQCPVAQSYQDRIKEFAKKYAGSADSKVAVVAINVNRGEEESFPEMVKYAKEHSFNFPYLHDETQEIGRKLGATVTPEFFVLDRGRKIVYMGGMDDDVRAAKVSETYLAPAVDALLKGEKPAMTETAATGCSIQYQKK